MKRLADMKVRIHPNKNDRNEGGVQLDLLSALGCKKCGGQYTFRIFVKLYFLAVVNFKPAKNGRTSLPVNERPLNCNICGLVLLFVLLWQWILDFFPFLFPQRKMDQQRRQNCTEKNIYICSRVNYKNIRFSEDVKGNLRVISHSIS